MEMEIKRMGKVRNMSWPVLVAWTSLLVLAGACASQAVSASESTATQSPPTSAAVPTSQPTLSRPTEVVGQAEEPGDSQDSSSPLVYTNDTYGFQLTLPSSWYGYNARELAGNGVGSVCFSFGGDMPICVLQIDVYTHAQWSQLQKLNEGYYLGQSDSYVFGAGPYTEVCVQMDEFQCDRYHELPAILETFEAK